MTVEERVVVANGGRDNKIVTNGGGDNKIINNASVASATTSTTENGGGITMNSYIKKSLKEADRRRRRRKQKKNKTHNNNADTAATRDVDDDDNDHGDVKTTIHHEGQERVEVEYVPEKTELDEDLLDDFKKVFEKFSFGEAALGDKDDDKKDEAGLDAAAAAAKKQADSDEDEDEQDGQQKEKGVSNKKKKLQRRMKIAELKQICSRPDVVEVWDATAADPKLLVFLKSYRNTVPVPRHWCQKRKFLQGDLVTHWM